MRSTAARLMLGLVAWVAIGAAGLFVVQSEQRVAGDTAALRTFDTHAREITDALADMRAAQQAYVAAGQGVRFWMPKVAETVATATAAVMALRASATSGNAQAALEAAAGTIADFAGADKRVRDYLNSGEPLMAADVIFAEGAQAAVNAAHQVEAARIAEYQAADEHAADLRKREAAAAGGAAGLVALVVLLLIPGRRVETAGVPAAAGGPLALSIARPSAQALDPEESEARPAVKVATLPPPPAPRTSAPVLKAAASLATDLGRVRDVEDLTALLGRAAEVMDATGLVVWLGSPAGADLRPVLSHGYAPQLVARMASVPRSGDNAAAAAYRSGKMQIVLSRPGGAKGGIVAPLLAADGCIGALSAEVRGGAEGSDSVQALATIVAAHLAGILTPAAAAAPAEESATQAANS